MTFSTTATSYVTKTRRFVRKNPYLRNGFRVWNAYRTLKLVAPEQIAQLKSQVSGIWESVYGVETIADWFSRIDFLAINEIIGGLLKLF